MMPLIKSPAQGSSMRALRFSLLLTSCFLLLISFGPLIGVAQGFCPEGCILLCDSLDQEAQMSTVWKVTKISGVRRSEKLLDGMLLKQKLKKGQVYLEVSVYVENLSNEDQTLDLPQPAQAIYLEQMGKNERFPVGEVITDNVRQAIEFLAKKNPNAVSQTILSMQQTVPSQKGVELSLVFIVPKRTADSDFLLIFIDALPQPLVSTSPKQQ